MTTPHVMAESPMESENQDWLAHSRGDREAPRWGHDASKVRSLICTRMPYNIGSSRLTVYFY